MGAVEEVLRVGGFFYRSCDGLAVARGTTRADSLQLATDPRRGKQVYRFVTVDLGTGATLPIAQEGLDLVVINTGLNPLQLYGTGGDTINGTAGNVGVALAASGIFRLICPIDGFWYGS